MRGLKRELERPLRWCAARASLSRVRPTPAPPPFSVGTRPLLTRSRTWSPPPPGGVAVSAPAPPPDRVAGRRRRAGDAGAIPLVLRKVKERGRPLLSSGRACGWGSLRCVCVCVREEEARRGPGSRGGRTRGSYLCERGSVRADGTSSARERRRLHSLSSSSAPTMTSPPGRLLPALADAYVRLAAARDIGTKDFADAAEAVLPLFDKLGEWRGGGGGRGGGRARGRGGAAASLAPRGSLPFCACPRARAGVPRSPPCPPS